MVLDTFLRQHNHELEDVLKRVDYTESQMKSWTVIQYPDELLYALRKITRKKISVILYELLQLENPGRIRRVASDYALLKAIENEVTYIFITKDYRKTQTKFLTDLLIEKEIFELELGPLAKYNFVGKKIYESFLVSLGRGEQYKKVEAQLADYFVLVHDSKGSLLCHSNFTKK